MPIKLDSAAINTITAFELLTKTRVVDFFPSEEMLYFVVGGKNLGAVIGREGHKIKTLEAKMGKRIKVFAYSPDVEAFVRNLLLVPVRRIAIKDGKKTRIRVSISRMHKPLVLGRGGKNFFVIQELLRRQFGAELEIK